MFSRKLLTLQTKKYIKNNQVKRNTLAYKDAKKVGIVFSVEDLEKHKTIKSFVKQLESDGKAVDVLCYLPRDRHNFEFKFDFFTGNDFTFFGKPTSKDALKFADQPFDYLFYIDTEPNFLIENLIAMSQARCRIGKYTTQEMEVLFDLMIRTKENTNTKELVDEMYRYAKILE